MRTVLVVAVLVASMAACKSEARRDPLPPGEAAQLLAERVWLDHPPQSKQDRFYVALFDRSGFAMAQRRTAWRGEFEIITWKVRGDRLELTMPNDDRRVTTRFRIERIAHRHADADVRLILDENPLGPREYKGYALDRGAALTPATVDAWLRAQVP